MDQTLPLSSTISGASGVVELSSSEIGRSTARLRIRDRPHHVRRGATYDAGADVLYLSVEAPRPALGIDIGDGVVLRYVEAAREVIGVTLVGRQVRLLHELSAAG